jgi:uncharacterized protein (DUF433 family)
MTFPASPYIEERFGGLYIAGTRMPLDCVVTYFQEGDSPERIIQSVPILELWQVYGAIAYYLQHEQLIRDYIAESDRRFRELVPPLSQQNPELYARLEAARERMGLNRA